MKDRLKVEKVSGKKAIKLEDDGFGLTLLVMKNGFQWSGTGVDDELLDMIVEVIDMYKSSKNKCTYPGCNCTIEKSDGKCLREY